MTSDKRINILLAIVYVVLGIAAIYFVLPKLLVIFLPFIIAYLLSCMGEPLVQLLTKKLKLKRKVASAVLTFLILFIIGGIIWFLSHQTIDGVRLVKDNWTTIYETSKQKTLAYLDRLLEHYYALSPGSQEFLMTAYNTFKAEISAIVTPIADASLSFATSFAKKLPSAIIFTIITLMATYFISSDRKRIRTAALKVVGEKAAEKILGVWEDLKHAVGGYVRAQLIIMCIVSTIAFIGFLVAGVPYALLVAIGVGLFDAFPVFGSGGILIPWAIVSFIMSDIRVGITMLVTYGVIVIMRQLTEPRIVGKQIGIPPLVTLMAMYVGLRLFGIFGMILGPIVVLIIKNLYKSGAFDYIVKSVKN